MYTAFLLVRLAISVFKWSLSLLAGERECHFVNLNKYSNSGIHHKYLKLLFVFNGTTRLILEENSMVIGKKVSVTLIS